MGMTLTIGEAVALAREVAKPILGAVWVEEIWRAAEAPDPGAAPDLPKPGADPGPVPAHVAAVTTLTFREQDVLELLCQRLTDAEIAERLFLSRRTVSHHVGNVMGKLGAANRRAAAAIAARDNLV